MNDISNHASQYMEKCERVRRDFRELPNSQLLNIIANYEGNPLGKSMRKSYESLKGFAIGLIYVLQEAFWFVDDESPDVEGSYSKSSYIPTRLEHRIAVDLLGKRLETNGEFSLT